MFWFWALIGIATLILLECIREVHTFQVTYYQIKSTKLSPKRKHTLILLSDLHSQCYGKCNEKLLETIRKQAPEVILIAGDMLVGSKRQSPQVALDFVKELTQVCPVYYANGNHEQRLKEGAEIPGTDFNGYRQKLVEAGVIYLENTKAELTWDECKVEIHGLELPNTMYTKFQKNELPKKYMECTLGKVGDDKYHILIAHNPAFAEDYASWGADLIVSGHLHGGIARIPYWRGVISPQGRLFPKYSGELSWIGKTAMVVSKGIGIHTIKLRFLNPAEVVVLQVGGSED